MSPKYSAIIVEDEVIISMLISEYVKEYGVEVLGRANGKDELEKLLQNQQPDIIFMDIYLEGPASGIDIVKDINKNSDYIIVYMTANSDAKTKQRALGTNHFAYIQKPVTDAIISDVISDIRNSRIS